MRNYKKIICLYISALLLLTLLYGCGETDNTGETIETTGASEVSFSYSEGIDENGFWEDITALDLVETFDYKAFSIPNDVHKITDDELQEAIEVLLKEFSTDKEVTDRKIKDGDTVNIDYVGSVDGVEFDNGSTEGAGTDVTIGVTNYIDDFLEQLIGHKPGETINIVVTFPDDYGTESLQGKDAVFVTEINYIVETELPEFTNKFVKTNLSETYGWNTMEEVKESKKEELKKAAINDYIYNYLCNDVVVESVPENIIECQNNMMVNYYKENASSYGVGLEEYLNNYFGISNTEELIEKNKETNKKNAIYSLAVQAVAEDSKITVSEDDVTEYFVNYMGTEDYSTYEEEYGMPYLKQITLTQKIINYIADNAVLA